MGDLILETCLEISPAAAPHQSSYERDTLIRALLGIDKVRYWVVCRSIRIGDAHGVILGNKGVPLSAAIFRSRASSCAFVRIR